MKRRKFIQNSSLLALSVGVFGKIKWDGEKYVGTDPTTTDILGPFYRPGAPFKTDLVQAGTKGEIMHFSGTVFGKDGKALKGALVEIWHCNENGEYDNTSDDYVYRASFKTAADGNYHFKSIYPVPYAVSATLTRPAHIHMRISGDAQTQDLVTQVYFKGDKHLAEDLGSNNPKALNRILDLSKNEKNEKVIKFDVHLTGVYALEPSAFEKIVGLYQMSDNSMCEFYKDGDLLFAKINGQIMESLDYKGNNTFQGGAEYVTAKFEWLSNGKARVKVTFKEGGKSNEIEGGKLLRY